MLGRELRSANELVMIYAGVLAHGTALSAAETARMIPQLSANAIRQAMRFAADERRLAQASGAVLAYMHRFSVAAAWGRSDLASSDMMSLETSRRVWQARVDPRRQTPSVGIYTHVRDRWGISYVQPIVLNERQAGAAIEGVVRDEALETGQLAVDTHGYTDVAMALSRLLGFDLCPRLKALSDRHLFLPRGAEIPEAIRAIVRTRIEPNRSMPAVSPPSRPSGTRNSPPLAMHWVCWRTSSWRGIPPSSRGRAGRVPRSCPRSRSPAPLQTAFDRRNARRATAVPPQLMGRIAPTRTEGINLRGVFRFPIEAYADRLLPGSSLKAASGMAQSP